MRGGDGSISTVLKTRFYHPNVGSRRWFLVDAEGIALGRLSTKIASILMGKGRTDFSPDVRFGGSVIVINASKLVVTGKKLQNKKYYWHTGYPGGIKHKCMYQIFEKDPANLVYRSVKGMLPKNRLGKSCGSFLRVYANAEHPHVAQTPICV